MRNLVLFVSLFLVYLTSCKNGGTLKDEGIAPEIKSQISTLNKQIIEGFKENNADKIFMVCSENLLKQGKDDIQNLVQQVGPLFSYENFKILNEYYQINSAKGAQTNVVSGADSDHDYIIKFNAQNSEMFISVGYFENNINQPGLILIYGKYGNDWKLNILQQGALKIENKDAIDWYLASKDNYEKGYIIDAVNDLALSFQLLRPANQYLQYQKDKEIQAFGRKLTDEVNEKFTFPMTVGYLDTKPQIFRIFPQEKDGGYYPMIQYATTVDMSDSTKLSEECDEMHKKIGELYNGIDKNNKMIIYKAYKSIPDSNFPVENIEFVRNN